ncbi:MAG: hypothetical protein M1830_004247 [Pleopsidium flavum]|nr:MAG: hypothetical protein M1830_004247 [Pleopsidium flavum]
MPGRKARGKARVSGNKNSKPSQASPVDQDNIEHAEQRGQPMCHLMSLPMELYALVLTYMMAQKTDISALSQTCSTLHAWTMPLLYEDIIVRVSPEQPLCLPPLRGIANKRTWRLTAGLGPWRNEVGSTSDVHKLIHSKFAAIEYVRKLRVVPASRELPSWQSIDRAMANMADGPRSRATRSTGGTRQESTLSFNIAMLIDRMPKLVKFAWEIDNFIGETLQLSLCKSGISSIEVGTSNFSYQSREPTSFLHQNHAVMARMPALRRLVCGSIGNSLQLQKIGVFIGLNPCMEELALGLHEDFIEQIIPDGPEGLGILIRAIVETQRSFLQAPLSVKCCPHQFCLRDLRLSTFSMDEDAEKGLSFVLNHCPLETFLMHNVAIYGDLSTVFNAWRRPQALSCLRQLIFETDTIDEHAINFSAMTGFLAYLGRIPHKLHSLELLGGWRLLNIEDADIKNLKASTLLDGLRTLIWESCVARWCHDCVSDRATRTEMSIFADLASCCPNIVVLGLPGFFAVPGVSESSVSEGRTAALLQCIPRLPHLRHLHIQETDRFQSTWSSLALFPILARRPPTTDVTEDLSIFVKNSPRPAYSPDDDFFRLVARAIAVLSLARFAIAKNHGDCEFSTVTFGMMKSQTHVWNSRFVRLTAGEDPSLATDPASLRALETFKTLPSVPLSLRS